MNLPEVPKYFSYFSSLLLTYSIEKEFKMEKNHRGLFSPRPAQAGANPGPSPHASRPASPLLCRRH
jgi:hypothetical protein